MTDKGLPPTHAPIGSPKGIGVFICSCGGVISRKLDFQSLRAIAVADPNVRDVICSDRCCDGAAMGDIKLSLVAGDIDRFIILGCSARTAPEQFTQLAEEAGICPDLVTFTDLLDMCALHPKAEAQVIGEHMLRVSLKRSAMLQITPRSKVEASRTVLIIGNGPSAITASRSLLDEGLSIIVANPAQCLEESDHKSVIPLAGGALELMSRAAGDRFRVFDATNVSSLSGSPGKFTVALSKDGNKWNEMVGGVIIALDKVETANPMRSRFPGAIDPRGIRIQADNIGKAA